jgi:C_GCAxxG_C_C family probable redox protein
MEEGMDRREFLKVSMATAVFLMAGEVTKTGVMAKEGDMDKVKKMLDLHRNGGMTCSQALLTVYGETYGIDPGKAVLLGRPLAGGMGGQGETCGYIAAAILILAYAYNNKDEAEARKNTHPVVVELFRRFKERYGTTMCKELLGADMSSEEGRKKIREEKLLAKHCHCDGGIGRYVAGILEELI